MENLNTYIIEKFKISKDIKSLPSTDAELINKMIFIVNQFKKSVKGIGWILDPEFKEFPEDKEKRFRLYPNKNDSSINFYGKTILDLYSAIVNFFGTKEDKEELEEIKKEIQNN